MSNANRNKQGTEDFLEGSALIAPATAAVRKAMSDVVNPVRRLSFFQRQEAQALGKSLDSHGNINLNEVANQTTQGPGSGRLNPNVRASQSDPLVLNQTSKAEHMTKKSMCHRHCKKSTGRSNCPHCLGQGWDSPERVGSN